MALLWRNQPVDQIPIPARSGCNSHVSGKNGGHDLNLWEFARAGVVLLGRLEEAADTKIRLAGDLQRNLHAADAAAARITERIDEFIATTGTEAPQRATTRCRFGCRLPGRAHRIWCGNEAEAKNSFEYLAATLAGRIDAFIRALEEQAGEPNLW